MKIKSTPTQFGSSQIGSSLPECIGNTLLVRPQVIVTVLPDDAGNYLSGRFWE